MLFGVITNVAFGNTSKHESVSTSTRKRVKYVYLMEMWIAMLCFDPLGGKSSSVKINKFPALRLETMLSR